MSDEHEVTLKRDQIDPLYLAHYLEFLQQTKAHVSGRSDTVPFLPSFIAPTGCWTSQEKDTFFHGLSLHSRLRPDLIADCIKTKSIADVCNYLDVLEDAIVDGDGEKGAQRKTFPGAMQVTPEWVEFEEEKAMAIVAAEDDWNDDAVKESREEEVVVMKRTLWGKTKSNFKPWEKKQRRRWENEDFCKSLDNRDLTALNTIIRGAEANVIPQPGSRASSQSRQSTVPRDTSAPPLTPTSSTFDDLLIDPALMVQSPPQPTQGSTALPPVSFVNAPPARSPSPGPSIIPADLSPASRRRLTKRLYMRRKRAKETGQEVDEDIGRLKPGRKAKRTKKTSAAKSTEMNGEHDGNETLFRHPNPSGMTLPYKVLTKFTKAGIEAEVLTELGLDLFHLPSMSKLMSLQALAYEEGSELGTSISQQTIKLLRAHVVRFLTDVLHRVIIVREQELSLKSHTKVWKVSNAQVITKENVEIALGMMDFRAVRKEQYFERLIEELGVSENDDMDVDDEEPGPSSLSKKSLAASKSGSPEVQLPPHREIYTPFVRLLSSLDTEDESLLSDETDEDQLIDELLEEEELDKMDEMLDQMHEKGLWERFRDNRQSTSFLSMKLAEWDNDEDEALHQPSDDADEEGRGRQIKSKAYISDSD